MLQAGPLFAGYENGFLRRITYGESEVLRMIYFALRDHNWNTLPFRIENENISFGDADFRITYDCFNTDGGVTVMEWKAAIQGKDDATITFEIRGTATETFRKNRAGFCVLHPLNLTGTHVTVTHPDQSKTTHAFPAEIAPEDPFKYIESMEWRSADVPFALFFEGDIFETEDQRNWGDASFKTFCTPLDKPFPAELRRGDKVFQRITFKPLVRLAPPKPSRTHIFLRETGTRSLLPFFGIGESTETTGLGSQAVDLIRALNLRHYRVDVYPGNDNWVTDFSGAYEIGFSLGLPLEAVLHLTEKYREEIGAFVAVCLQNRVELRKVLLLKTKTLVTDQKIIGEVSQLKAAFPRVLVGGGTNYNFNEINKNRFSPGELDYVSFSVDPQEHAFDDLTIIENMEAQSHLIRSAKAIYGESMPVHVSPITLRKRFNPYATNPADLHISESAKADPRQKEAFAALWTFGSLCSLSKGGAAAVTFFQTAGGQGIVSNEGEPYPVYHTLKTFLPYQGKEVSILESTEPLAVQGMVLDGKFLALMNLTQEDKTVQFNDMEVSLSPLEMKMHGLYRS